MAGNGGETNTKKLFEATITNLSKAIETEKKAMALNESQKQLELARLQKVKADVTLKLMEAK